jgi:murein DD-endopeptidase MepM/ murein hydrolase activator NlpD
MLAWYKNPDVMNRVFFRYHTFLKTALGALLLAPVARLHNAVPGPLPEPEIVAAAFPKDYFERPVEDQLRLTGTFGELRANHFHSGVDIKSKTGKSGQPVLSAAEGHVATIKVQADGYGNVLYIKHPNGYTTVYAHLDRFAPAIQKYVREEQYKRARFEVTLSPPAAMFPVKRGQEIGKLGNSGSSTGPHLHFEIRNTATQKVLNPELFGLPVADRTPPEIRDMKIYFLNDYREALFEKALPVEKRPDGTYHLKGGDTLLVSYDRVGFAVKAYDRMDYLRNDNGIYGITLDADAERVFDWRMDDLDFDETRYMNAHADYSAKQRFGAWFHRCFILPGNRLSNYRRTPTLGAVQLYPNRLVKMTLKAVDANGNTASITFWAQRTVATDIISLPAFDYLLPWDAESRIDLDGLTLVLPKGALYETLPFLYLRRPEKPAGAWSPVHQIHHKNTPIHTAFQLKISPSVPIPEKLRPKALIARVGGTRPVSYGGSWQEGQLVTRTREFGDFCMLVDTIPPAIVPVTFERDMRKRNAMSFRIRDNFGAAGPADDPRYTGTIDGQWVLFEYDAKRNRLTHTFDSRTKPGEHTLRLTVTDDRGNISVYEKNFLR